MIFGTKDVITTYKGISENIDRAIDYILEFDDNTPCGRYEIDGDRIYANVINGTASSMDQVTYEAHRKYLDLQYIIEGEEVMVHAMLSECKQETEYDESKDVWFFSGEGTSVKVKAGSFYLVHPFDAHAPGKGFEPHSYKKVIVKIRV